MAEPSFEGIPIRQLATRAVAAYIQWQKEKALKECMFISSECEGPIVRAHSVQSSRILDTICEGGRAYMFKLQPTGAGELALIGKNQATIFTGACEYHDRVQFREIDFDNRYRFDPHSERQQVLFFLRATACEHWKKMNAELLYRRMSSLIAANDVDGLKSELGYDDTTARFTASRNPDNPRAFWIGTKHAVRRNTRTFESLRKQLQKDRFHLTLTHVYHLPSSPVVAASSLFGPEFDLEGVTINTFRGHEDVADVALTVLPHEGATWFLFSHHRRHSNRLAKFFMQIDQLNGDELGIFFSRLLLIHCENVVYSPRLFEKLAPDVIADIETLFAGTTFEAIEYEVAPDINFFTD